LLYNYFVYYVKVQNNNNQKKLVKDYKNVFCSPLAHTVLQKKICKDLAMFLGFWSMFDFKMNVKVKYFD
jgi:hypothetical protein